MTARKDDNLVRLVLAPWECELILQVETLALTAGWSTLDSPGLMEFIRQLGDARAAADAGLTTDRKVHLVTTVFRCKSLWKDITMALVMSNPPEEKEAELTALAGLLEREAGPFAEADGDGFRIDFRPQSEQAPTDRRR